MSDHFITSYSHIAEDILLRRALLNVEAGFYIDIGAYDPVLESITKIFYDAGWSGINVEPNPRFHKRLVDQRTRDVNLGCAVSDVSGELELNVIEDTGLTTLDAEIAEVHAGAGYAMEKITVQTLTLKEMWAKHVPAGQDVHFLKIDVEGAEEQVIRGGDWAANRPWILMVEATLPKTAVQNHQGWEPTLLKADYLYAYFDGVNRYYVAKEKQELLAAFDTPLNVAIDKYIPFMAHLEQERLANLVVELEKVEAARKADHTELLDLRARHTELMHERNSLQQYASWLEGSLKHRPRPLWERLLFRSTGRPTRALRKLFFHSSGKPRGVFRKYILRSDGLPRSAFYAWMSSQAYQGLRLPIQIPGGAYSRQSYAPAVLDQPMELSRRGKEIEAMLQSGKGRKGDPS